MPATSIDSHQCVRFLRAHSTLHCFELTDRIIVICSLSSPGLFDLYKSLWGRKITVVNISCSEAKLQFILLVKEVGKVGREGCCSVEAKPSLIRRECFYAHTVSTCKYSSLLLVRRRNWRLEWRSFDLLRALSRKQFRNSSQDTLQRRAMLPSCFTCVRSASGLSNRLSSCAVCVCRCGLLSLISWCIHVYLHVWPFVVLSLHAIAHL